MRATIIALILTFSSIVTAETRKYDVLLGDKVVGSVIATKTINGNEITYKTDFRIKIKIFKTYNVRSVSTSTFIDNKMTWGHMIIYRDDEIDEEVVVTQSGTKYIQSNISPPNDITTKKILTDVTKIYFVEPLNGSDIFSARFLDFGQMTKIREHEYKFKLPSGDTNKYYFQNGKLDKISVNRTFFKLTFQYRS